MDNLAAAIIGHLAGDYLLQTDWIAGEKKKSSAVCALHALLWTLCVCAFAGWWKPAAAGALFATHFLQDRTHIILRWMRFMHQRKFITGDCAPWSVIVVDNVWHMIAIYAVGRFLL